MLIDPADGRVLQQFDLSTHEIIPSSFPYTVVATRDGRRAWCSLWNSSQVAELDLEKGTVTRWISLLEPKDPVAPGSHPTDLLLSPDEKWLFVALSNADAVATVDAASGQVIHLASTNLPGQEHAGTYPTALAQSADGTRLFVADSSLNAVAVFEARKLTKPGISFPLPAGVSGFHSNRLVSQRTGGPWRRPADRHCQRGKAPAPIAGSVRLRLSADIASILIFRR